MGLMLSEKHGVNPTCSECYICGEVKEVVLMGRAGERVARQLGNKDGEMPSKVILDTFPCDKCRAAGIAFIEMDREGKDATPTGRRCLIRQSAVERMINDEGLLEHILTARMTYLTPQTSAEIGLFQPEGEIK